jgi:uncharacterized protein (TIGR03083 family)
MEIDAHCSALAEQGTALAAAAGRAGLTADVPTCPGWTVRHLLEHIGRVHRWAATYVQEGPAAFGGGSARMATPPSEGLLDWFVDGHAQLVAALRAAPDDLQCWPFLPAPSPLAFWARRQAHETAIHRADADAACGTVPSYAPRFAADGIDELLDGFYARRGGSLRADPPRSLLVVATDADRRWHLAIGPERREVTVDDDLPADCTVRGPASDLYLLLWNRPPVRTPEITGDQAVMGLWRDRAQIKWR